MTGVHLLQPNGGAGPTIDGPGPTMGPPLGHQMIDGPTQRWGHRWAGTINGTISTTIHGYRKEEEVVSITVFIEILKKNATFTITTVPYGSRPFCHDSFSALALIIFFLWNIIKRNN
jgi:hypothetical protein